MPITYAQDGTGGLPSTLRRPTVRKTVSPSGDPLAGVGLAIPTAVPSTPSPYQPQGWNYSDRVLKNVGQASSIGALNGWITPEYIQQMQKAMPGFFGDLKNPSSMLTPYMIEGDSGPMQLHGGALEMSPELAKLFSGLTIQRRGVEGLGRNDLRTNVLVDANGNVVYAGDPYRYNPSGETWKALGEVGLLAGAAFGGLGLAGAGPLGGVLGGGASTAGGAAAGSAASGAASGSLIDAALAEAMMTAGTLAPEGVAALGLTGAELGALGGGSLLAGGALGGGLGAAAPAVGAVSGAWNGTDFGGTVGAGTAVPAGTGAGASGIDKVLGALGSAGSNLIDKAIENPLQTAALVGSVGALAGAKPSAAPSFDAEGAAAAQGEANRDASWFDAVLNRPDMQTPWGSSTWTLREGADPKNPKPGDWVNTVALNAEQQALLDAQNRLSAGYASTAEGMLGRVQDTYGQPFDLSSLPGLPDFGTLNSDLDRKRVEDALLARLEPQLQQEEERARTRLLNTGFEYGSEGSNIELDRLARGRNDARLAAVLAAGDESSRLMGDQRSNLLAQLQARQQGFQEQSYQRALPLNELNAFRQGTQVQAPEFQSIIPTNTAASPELDALLAKLGIQQSAAANKQSGYNALLSAIGGLGAAWLGS